VKVNWVAFTTVVGDHQARDYRRRKRPAGSIKKFQAINVSAEERSEGPQRPENGPTSTKKPPATTDQPNNPASCTQREGEEKKAALSGRIKNRAQGELQTPRRGGDP